VVARRAHLHRLAYALYGDWDQADDLVQTALAKTYVAGPRVRRRQFVVRERRRSGAQGPLPGAGRAVDLLRSGPRAPALDELDAVESVAVCLPQAGDRAGGPARARRPAGLGELGRHVPGQGRARRHRRTFATADVAWWALSPGWTGEPPAVVSGGKADTFQPRRRD
jgi:hypothetical protein